LGAADLVVQRSTTLICETSDLRGADWGAYRGSGANIAGVKTRQKDLRLR
jgi:hypothetical protein